MATKMYLKQKESCKMLPNNKKRQARWLMMLILIMIVSMLSACGKSKDDATVSASPGASAGPAATPAHKDSDVAAVYKGGQVTYGELNKYIDTTGFLNPQQASSKGMEGYDEYMLKQLVVFKVVGGRATAENKKAADTKATEQVDAFKKYYDENKATLDPQLKTVNVEVKDIEAYFHTMFYALMDMSSKVTDKQIQDDFDAKIKADKFAFTTATVDHILIALKDPADQTGEKVLRTDAEALARAKEVKAKLDKGGDFAALAKEYSDDPGSKDKGGRYENAQISGYVAEFKQAAGTLPINKISDPVKTSYGYHVMKVINRKENQLADVKESLRTELADGMFNDFMTNEFPSLEYKSNIPTPVPTPTATPAPSTEASPSATPVK
jgi:foldase protein PrsA